MRPPTSGGRERESNCKFVARNKVFVGVGVGGLYQILEEMERDPTRLFSFKQWLEERLLEKQMTWQKESNFFGLFEGEIGSNGT